MTPVIQDNPSGWGPCAVRSSFGICPTSRSAKEIGSERLQTGRGPHTKTRDTRISTPLSLEVEVSMLTSTRRMKLVSSWWTQRAHRRPPTSGIECDSHSEISAETKIDGTCCSSTCRPCLRVPSRRRENAYDCRKIPETIWSEAEMGPKSQKPRDSSVEVRSDWEVKEEMDFLS